MCLAGLVPASLTAQGVPDEEADDDLELQLGPLPKKRPSFFRRPSKKTSAEQLVYAQALQKDGRKSKAIAEYQALVHQWHDAKEAPVAQLACAELLEETGYFFRAFNEYQYLMENYAGRFPYKKALEHQFSIANHLRTERVTRFLVFKGTSPSRALPLYRKIVRNAPNWEKTSTAQFYVGWIHEQMRDYELAVGAYETAQYRYPKSAMAPRAAFRRAVCLHWLADRGRTDEGRLRAALAAYASFVRDHPKDRHVSEATKCLQELKQRLAAMHYKRALFYDNIAKRPRSALIAYTQFVRRFPLARDADRARDRIAALKTRLED
jgi:outer membrane protein assembly factor BamD (BamD/ComL family)